MHPIKRVVEIQEVCYYDGTNGHYIVDTFFGEVGYTFVSESGGVLTLLDYSGTSQTVNAGTYVKRNSYNDTQWRGTWTQHDLDSYFSVVGESAR